jgi:thermostable 8-oxoguanine DNA glycosylase
VKVSEKRESDKFIQMARDILETEMHSGLAFDKEEKVSRSELVEKMIGAGETAFTIEFNKKVDA